MPVVSGRLASRVEKASRPPAEAPIPTMGKTLSSAERDAGEAAGGEDRLLRFGVERFFNVRNSRQPENSGEKDKRLRPVSPAN